MRQLEPKDLAQTIIQNANVVDETKAPEIAPSVAPSSPIQAPEPLFDSGATLRHGRIAGRALGLGYKRATGEPLEDDVADTFGEAMGEVFGAINGAGNKLFYWGLLGISIAPVFLVIASEIFKVTKESKKDA